MLKRAILLIILLAFLPVSLAANNNNPYQEMKVVANRLFGALNNQKSNNDQNALEALIRENLLPYIQIKYSGALILGSYYQKVSPDQKDIYFKAFEAYLVHALAQALSLYEGQRYTIEPAKDLSGKNVVSIRVLLHNADKKIAPIRLDFQWRKNSLTGEWKAYDILTEGISMISTKQNEWATILRNDSIVALIQQLNNEATKPIKRKKSY